jgi:hypothetical protein
MRWKIIVVNAGILLVACVLTYALLWTSLREVVSNPAERKREVAQALRAASGQLALDALRMERWLSHQVESTEVRDVFAGGIPEARSERATAQANKLRDAAVAEADFAKISPSLVLFIDENGIALGRNGSALMRGDNMAAAYPALSKALKDGQSGSAVWLNRQRQEQLLVTYAPVRGADGAIAGAAVVGAPLNDERLTRTSELTSGQILILSVSADKKLDVIADSGADATILAAASSGAPADAAQAALASEAVTNADNAVGGFLFGAIKVTGYDGTPAVLSAAVPASLVASIETLLWPVFGVGALGLLLVIVGGSLLGNYIARPVSELEDGLLAIINGNQDLRFQLEHPELGGLVFRINSLLNALMGVPEDTTDEEGRPSMRPSGKDFTEALSVDESFVAGQAIDPNVARALAAEPPESYYARLFNEYLSAKRQLGDPVDHVTLPAFQARIQSSEAETGQKHGVPVRYQVQLRGGAVVLIAVPLR